MHQEKVAINNDQYSYSMKTQSEFDRLISQNQLSQYDISKELSFFEFQKDQKVLDAGCGAGDVHISLAHLYHHLNLKIDAFDSYEFMLSQSKKRCKDLGLDHVHHFESDIYAIKAKDESYDKVICRFVLEHLDRPIEALKEMKRVLKKGGHLYLIDLDGVLFNIDSSDHELMNWLKRLEQNFSFDLYIGRKLSRYMNEVGLHHIQTHIEAMNFYGEDLDKEIINVRERFLHAREVFIKALDEESYHKFSKRYLDELMKERSLFYNKFLVSSQKL